MWLKDISLETLDATMDDRLEGRDKECLQMSCGYGEIESWKPNTKIPHNWQLLTRLTQAPRVAWLLWARTSRTSIHCYLSLPQHPATSGHELESLLSAPKWSGAHHLSVFLILQNEIPFVLRSFTPLFIDSRNTHGAFTMCQVVFCALERECRQNGSRLLLMPLTL